MLLSDWSSFLIAGAKVVLYFYSPNIFATFFRYFLAIFHILLTFNALQKQVKITLKSPLYYIYRYTPNSLYAVYYELKETMDENIVLSIHIPEYSIKKFLNTNSQHEESASETEYFSINKQINFRCHLTISPTAHNQK